MTPRFVICIPVYNNPETIAEVVSGCLRESSLNVIVIDDGSTQPVRGLCEDSARITWVRLQENQGKGVALQEGFRVSLEAGYTHMIAIDADGQHAPADIPRLVDASFKDPWVVVVGDRDMNSAQNVPGSSIFGKAFSNFWVKYQTDVDVLDSQSGFRIYPLFHVQGMKFFSKKYDFEVEVLTRLIWKDVRIKNVPISVKYFPPEKRVSHFHKWRDNFRITVINTIMTTRSLVHGQMSPWKTALAFGIGIFVGCTPLFGLHTGIVAFLAFALRLNFVAMWLGTQISIPPLIPFLIYGSGALGEMILREPPSGVFGFTHAWMVGSLALGAILGSAAFLTLFLILTLRGMRDGNQKKSQWSGGTRNRAGIWFVRMLLTWFGIGPAYFFVRFVALYYFLVSLRTRRSLSEYWRTIQPGIGFWRRQVCMYNQILVFARTLVDRGVQRHSGRMDAFDVELDSSVSTFAASSFEKGAVIVASHFGGWEMALTFLASSSTGRSVLAVMHGERGGDLHESGKHKKRDTLYFNLEEHALLRLRRQLEVGQCVGMMGDRPVTRSCELIPFFGKLALFDTTPFRLAMATDAELYFIFSVKTETRRYRIYAYPCAVSGKGEEALARMLGAYALKLESLVREYPEQWFNFFPFWSDPVFKREEFVMGKV